MPVGLLLRIADTFLFLLNFLPINKLAVSRLYGWRRMPPTEARQDHRALRREATPRCCLSPRTGSPFTPNRVELMLHRSGKVAAGRELFRGVLFGLIALGGGGLLGLGPFAPQIIEWSLRIGHGRMRL